MTPGRIAAVVAVVFVCCFVALCLGVEQLVIFLFDLVFQVFCGWALFLARVLPKMSVDPSAVATAVVCVVLLAVGLHLFMRWLYAGIQESRPAEWRDSSAWRLRWTGMILALVVLLFTAGISSVGIAHQSGWLFAKPGEIVTFRSGFRDISGRMISQNNLKQIGTAVHNYASANEDAIPPGVVFDRQGNALHAWQTLLLPYIEQDALFRQVDMKAPWAHARNVPHFRNVVQPYLHPSGGERLSEDGLALSHYAANVRLMGAGPAWAVDKIPDGSSNTILAGEAWAAYKPWGVPGNWRDPAQGIHTTPDSFGSPMRTHYAQFVMADGSVKSMSKDVSREVLNALSTPDGGEQLGNDW